MQKESREMILVIIKWKEFNNQIWTNDHLYVFSVLTSSTDFCLYPLKFHHLSSIGSHAPSLRIMYQSPILSIGTTHMSSIGFSTP